MHFLQDAFGGCAGNINTGLMGTINWHLLLAICITILAISSHLDLSKKHTRIPLRKHSAVRSLAYCSACLGSKSTQPVGSRRCTAPQAAQAAHATVGKTFSFIGQPRDVIVLSVSIGHSMLSHIPAHCSLSANAGVHYLHGPVLKA